MKLLKLFPAMFLFWYPRKKLRAIVLELQRLSPKLKEFGESKDPIPTIVQFFDEVSKWYDRRAEIQKLSTIFGWINFGQHDKTIENLKKLDVHFCNAGARYGWNRTEKGEEVTEDKVFLGNISGIRRLSVSYFTKTINNNSLTYFTITLQARDFMKLHIDPMIKSINHLKKSVA